MSLAVTGCGNETDTASLPVGSQSQRIYDYFFFPSQLMREIIVAIQKSSQVRNLPCLP